MDVHTNTSRRSNMRGEFLVKYAERVGGTHAPRRAAARRPRKSSHAALRAWGHRRLESLLTHFLSSAAAASTIACEM